ncbi:hypothetical protein [Streptomyces sp. st115]|uniref:hypothetical protein n=1 Tax=Streptomyces sp. st115 TaxID=1828047 RepID=UPI0015CF2465|nr:hypothetical protein [Streptomyces sp. st115]
MQQGWGSPYQQGFRPAGGPRSGKAFFLGLLVSGALGLVYSGILLATHKDLSRVGLQASYLVLAAALAVGVGAVVGRTGGRAAGPQVWAAILATPAAYFGVANGYVFTLLDAGGVDLLELVLENEPLAPHKFWWHRLNGGVALVGLVVAAGGAFAVANVIGKKHRRPAVRPPLRHAALLHDSVRCRPHRRDAAVRQRKGRPLGTARPPAGGQRRRYGREDSGGRRDRRPPKRCAPC